MCYTNSVLVQQVSQRGSEGGKIRAVYGHFSSFPAMFMHPHACKHAPKHLKRVCWACASTLAMSGGVRGPAEVNMKPEARI